MRADPTGLAWINPVDLFVVGFTLGRYTAAYSLKGNPNVVKRGFLGGATTAVGLALIARKGLQPWADRAFTYWTKQFAGTRNMLAGTIVGKVLMGEVGFVFGAEVEAMVELFP